MFFWFRVTRHNDISHTKVNSRCIAKGLPAVVTAKICGRKYHSKNTSILLVLDIHYTN